MQQAKGTISGPWYNDTSPYFLYGFMGTDVATQPNAGTAPTVYLHSMALADTPPSLTLFKSYDAAAYYFAYSVVEKVVFKFTADGKLLEADFDVQDQYGIKVSSPPSPSFSGLLPFAGYLPTIQIDAASSNDVEEMQITMQQKVTLFYPANGSRQFATAYFGERTAKLEGTLRFDTDTFYNYFLTGMDTFHHFNVVFTGPTIASTYHQSLTLDFPIVAFDDMEHETGKDNVEVKFNGTAMPGTTANSLMTAQVQNTVVSYTS